MLIVPNLIWMRNKPAGYSPEGESCFLVWMERAGQVCVTASALMFSDYNWKPASGWSVWLFLSFFLMLCYEFWWIRYFHSLKRLRDFYSSLFGIPVAGAVFPVMAFFLLGIYGKVIWMILSAILLGIGHIGIHLKHLAWIRRAEHDGI